MMLFWLYTPSAEDYTLTLHAARAMWMGRGSHFSSSPATTLI